VKRCSHCGNLFAAIVPNQKTCSGVCRAEVRRMRDAVRSRRRRLRHALTWDGVSDNEILERDGWRCGVCHKKINPELKYPHLKSRSVDHVIPLSEGGDDTAINKRAAHLRCNLSRGARGGGEQLALIGVIRALDYESQYVGERVSPRKVKTRKVKAERVPSPCPICGTSTTRRRFCSDECMLEENRRRSRDRYRSRVGLPASQVVLRAWPVPTIRRLRRAAASRM